MIDTIDTRKGILPLMANNLKQFTPHIVLLMIGTNDINGQLQLSTAPDTARPFDRPDYDYRAQHATGRGAAHTHGH